jgi:uncharacterized protein YndB with AHSA1/START domain
MTTVNVQTTQVYQMFIKASAERIWQAITDPELTQEYFHGNRIQITPERRLSHRADGSLVGDSEVVEYDPPRRLVHGWHGRYDPEQAAEPPSRVTWEIEPREGGYCLLTLTHDRLEQSPRTAESVGDEGWSFVLSGLKTFAETGQRLSA